MNNKLIKKTFLGIGTMCLMVGLSLFFSCESDDTSGSGGRCGLSALYDNGDVSVASVSCGAALCEAVEEWPVEPVYVAA